MLPEQFLFEYIILVFWLVVAIKLPEKHINFSQIKTKENA